MDVNEFVPDVHSGESERDDIRPAAKQLKPEDLRPLEIRSLDQIRGLVEQYNALTIPKDPTETFLYHLTQQRNAWFVEAADVGLIYLTDLAPHGDGLLHVLFWDKSLSKDRREAIRSVIATAFHTFDLFRVSTVVPYTNVPMRSTVKKIGFVHEGTIRRAFLYNGERQDALLFGLLREEFTWPAVRMTSSV